MVCGGREEMLFFILPIVALPFFYAEFANARILFLLTFFVATKKVSKKNASQQKNSLRLRGFAAYGFAQQFLLQYCAPSAHFIFYFFY
jgi:hypothetical protein